MRTWTTILTLGILTACSTSTDNEQTDQTTDTTTVQIDTSTMLIDNYDQEDQLTFDHIDIDKVPYWYADYDSKTKTDVLIKGLLVDETSKTAGNLIEILNKGQDTQIVFDKINSDTLYVKLTDSYYVTERSGTTGAQWYMASATFTLTEIGNVNYVYFDFEVGSHLSSGVYDRQSFEGLKIITRHNKG